MFPQILLSVDDDRLLNSNHTCWHSAYLTYDSMFLLCLTAHLSLPKSLDYRINGAFRAWRPPELLWTHLKYLFSGILTRGISDSMCHSINAFEIAISFFIFQFRTTSIDSCTHSAKVKPFYFEISFCFYRFSELFSFRATTPAYVHIMIYSSTNFIIILPLLQ